MLFRRERKGVPLLNTTSTADISFMLLILFLVTTSMDIDKGLSRQLPPQNPTEEEQPMDVKEGMVLKLELTEDNQLLCEGEPLPLNGLRQRVETHVLKAGKDHVVQLQAHRRASYDMYFQVQNELVAAYGALRNQQARRRFGHSYARCSDEQQAVLREAIPQRISEIYQSEEGGHP